MAENGKVTFEESIDKKVFDIGQDYAKSLQPGINANRLWLESFEKIKAAAFQYADLEKKFSNVKGKEQFLNTKKEEIQLTEQIVIALKEQQRAEKLLITTKERKNLATEGTVKALTKERLELQRVNKLEKEEAILKSKTSSLIDILNVKRARATRKVQDLNAKKALGNKLSLTEQLQLKRSTKAFNKYDKAIKVAKTSTKQFQENVGNYPKQLRIATSALRKLIPLIGAGLGLKAVFDFTKEARQLAIDAKGVEFAFKQIEERTGDAEAALLRVKKATRGLLSDLDIKKAIVELDNFNISTEETDTLLEFLAVRASQTGQSIDKLKDSLVEGLSKESKLRIDNLGISAKELNEELKRTPNFVKAVANIAKKEIKEAGNILDEASNAQAKWNADLENFKLAVGKGFVAKVSNAFYSLGSNILRAITPTKSLTDEIRSEQVELNTLVSRITDTNISNENRLNLINKLKKDYPFFLKFINDEKTSNENLSLALDEVNQLYIKQIAIKSQEANINKVIEKAGERANKNVRESIDLQRRLNEINNEQFDNRLDLNNKSLEEKITLIKQELSLRAVDERQGSRRRLNKEAEILNELNAKWTIYNGGIQNAKNLNKDLIEEQDLLKQIESELGTTLEEINKIFEANTKAKEDNNNKTKILTDSELKALEAKKKQLLEDRFNLKKAQIQSEIEAQKQILDNEKETISKRQVANTGYYEAKKLLLETIKTHEIENAQGRADKIKQIELQFTNDLNKLEEGKKQNSLKLLQDDFEQKKQLILEEKRLKKESLNEAVLNEIQAFDNLKKNGFGSNEAEKEAIEQHQNSLLEIKKRFALEEIQVQIDKIKYLIANESFSVDQQKQLYNQLHQLKISKSQIEATQRLEDLEKVAKKEAEKLQKDKETAEKIAQFKKEKITEASNVLAESLNLDAQNLDNFIAGIVDGFGEGIEGVLNGIQTTSAVVGDVVNAVFDANIENIERQIQANEEYYNRQHELATGDAEQQRLIRQEQEKKRQELEKKKRKEQVKQAKFNKGLKIFDIGISTALGIMQAYAQLGPIAGSVAAALVGALGAVQLAAVIAKPIPKFKDGHLSGTYEGWSITNDGGRDEVHERKDGSAYIIKGRNVPTYMKHGDKIHKSVEDYNNLIRASILASVDVENKKLNNFQAKETFSLYESAIIKELKLTRKAVENTDYTTHVQDNSEKIADRIAHALWAQGNTNWGE